MQDFLNVKEAAAFLGLSAHTLNFYRVSGDGPQYYRLGKLIRYDRCDLEAWARSKPCRSTSDASAA